MISTLNKISSTHNSCEDSVLVKENAHFIYGGVFDGCSTGTNSHWASRSLTYVAAMHDIPTKDTALYHMRDDLWQVMETLGLTDMHFLSTAILFCYSKFTDTLRIRAIGDGVYYVNDVGYKIEQNNTPDYLGYHLEDSMHDFQKFLDKYPEKIYENVTHFQICSDGIDSIGRSQFAPPTDKNALAMLLAPPKSPNYLERMWNILRKDHFTISDDLSIISYVKD